jgi:periplasmic protein TonB
LKTTGVDPKGCVKDIQGKVVLYLLIGKNGKVKQADIAKSSGSTTLDEAAKEVTSRIIFLPAVAPNGKIVRVWIKYPVSFSLK